MRILASLITTCLGLAVLHAADGVPRGHAAWLPSPEAPVGWRGDGTGVFPGATPPRSWDAVAGKDLLWKADLPWWGSCSPIVVGDRVFVSVEPGTLLCYGAADGKLLWHAWHDALMDQFPEAKAREIRAAWAKLMAIPWIDRPKDKETKDRMDRWQRDVQGYLKYGLDHRIGPGGTFPTPISDGASVYVSWGDNTVASYDVATGRRNWLTWNGPILMKGNSLDLQVEESQTSFWEERWVPSPVLVDGILIAYQGAVMRGFDAATGKLMWTFRLNEHAAKIYAAHDQLVKRKGATGHWGCATPALLDVDGLKVVVTGQGAAVRVADGGLACPSVGAMGDVGGSSPVADDATDRVWFPDYMDGGNGAATDRFWAVQLKRDGDRVAGTVLWQSAPKAFGGTGGSPLFIPEHGLLYQRGRFAQAVDGGGIIAVKGLKEGGYDSAAYGGGLLFQVHNEACQVVDVAAGRLLGANRLVLPGGKGDEERGRTQAYYDEMERRAKQAVADGIIPYVGPRPKHGSIEGCYGSAPFLHGSRVYIRTRMALYCVGR